MARNFAVVYLEQAVARAPPAERFAQASSLSVDCLPARPPARPHAVSCGCLATSAAIAAEALLMPSADILTSLPPLLLVLLLQLAMLLTGLSTRPQQHQAMLLRMAAQVRTAATPQLLLLLSFLLVSLRSALPTAKLAHPQLPHADS